MFKRAVLSVAALMLVLPAATLADGMNFGFAGGAIDASGTTLTTMSGLGVNSTLTDISQFPAGTPGWGGPNGNLGVVSFSTGDILGNCSVSATCYAAAGSVFNIVANSAFTAGINAGDALFTGAFIDIATAPFAGGPLPPGPYSPGTGAIFTWVGSAGSPLCMNQPAGTDCFRLYGTIAGTLNPTLIAALGLGNSNFGTGWVAHIDFVFAYDPNNPNLVLNIRSGDAQLIVPEPGTLALFGTGLIGIAGLIRRKLAA